MGLNEYPNELYGAAELPLNGTLRWLSEPPKLSVVSTMMAIPTSLSEGHPPEMCIATRYWPFPM